GRPGAGPGRADRRPRRADRSAGRRAHPLRGSRALDRDDQLRDHLRPDAAHAARLERCRVSAPEAILEERLARQEPVQAARRALAQRGSAWIVGGALRDALLGADAVADLDLAVTGHVAAA